jgi:hypothetical protein
MLLHERTDKQGELTPKQSRSYLGKRLKRKEMKKVLDVCCGARGMWFDKHDERALYIRMQTHWVAFIKE